MESGDNEKYLKELADGVELPRSLKRGLISGGTTTTTGGRGSGGRATQAGSTCRGVGRGGGAL